jgi:hypothetical protein
MNLNSPSMFQIIDKITIVKSEILFNLIVRLFIKSELNEQTITMKSLLRYLTVIMIVSIFKIYYVHRFLIFIFEVI